MDAQEKMDEKYYDDENIESIDAEVQDSESEQPEYEILTYPTDYTLEVLVSKLDKSIVVPEYQRGYVWPQQRASRLIESFLLGLPVPPVYLYQDASTNKLLVIDGQQRLKTVKYYFSGFFGEEKRHKKTVFRLKGISDESKFYDKSYKDIETEFPEYAEKLKDATLRAFIIKQLDPKDNTSVFHIFERLNTGGMLLKGQEIRNCVYNGTFNKLLKELNEYDKWREVFGREEKQKNLRDEELILRFLALYFNFDKYKKTLKDFLSDFMEENQNPLQEKLEEYKSLFIRTTDVIYENLGSKPFHIRAGLNAAVYDSVYIAFAFNIDSIPPDISERFKKLVKSDTYGLYISEATTNRDNIILRIEEVQKQLFQ